MKTVVSLLFLCAAAALGQAPDRAPLADEWGYRPADGATVAVNPPSLSWVLEKDAASYSVQWAGNAGFTRPITVRDLPWSVYTHHTALKPGRYWWRYRIAGKDGRESEWSRARSFTAPAEATTAMHLAR
jgi:hypothetical protein